MDSNLTPEQAIEKIDNLFTEKSAEFSTKVEMEAHVDEIKSSIESLNGLTEKNAELEKVIAKFEGKLEAFTEKAQVISAPKLSLKARIFKMYSDNIERIVDAIEKGTKISLSVKDTTLADYAGDYALTDFDTEVDRSVRPRYGILENANTGATTGKFVTYVSQRTDTMPTSEDAGWTAEGRAKSEGEPEWKEVSEEVKKIACYVKVSKEMLEDLSFIRAEINNDLMLTIRESIEQALISGTGVANLNGLLSPGMGLPAFGAGSFALSVPNANITDLIRVVQAQIEGANHTPTHVIMNPEDIAKLQLTKGTDNTYTYPMYLPTQDGRGEMVVAGMRVISSTYIAQDKYIVGDLSKLNVRFRNDIAMTVGLDQDDFTKNMVTMLAEARLVSYVKENQKTAFVVGTISTDITAITQP